MIKYYLENDKLKLSVESHGAQLCSISSNTREYLWNGDPVYWGWHSPILFPFVGRLKNSEYLYRGKKYPMKQHGFARDMDFALEYKAEMEIWFRLTWTKETLKIYPFKFVLHIGYRLEDNKVSVVWKVENQGSETMYFAIGGHPGFYCPINTQDKQEDYYLEFDRTSIEYCHIDAEGLLQKDRYQLPLTDCRYQLTEDTFKKDALVIETNQTNKISLCTPDQKPYVTVTFDSPSVGIYSPDKIKAPFVCIEPWYGRCDNVDFEGELKDREHEQKLKAGEEFCVFYQMEFN